MCFCFYGWDGTVRNNENAKKEVDVLFFGVITPDRKEFLDYIAKEGIALKNIGHEENTVGVPKDELLKIISKSKIYETSPMENLNQEYFLNQIIKVDTELDPFKLLSNIKNIENKIGRNQVSKRYMPRVIDIDILAL